jgi:peptidyl-prolyl cis-trans isomerase C
MRRFLLLLWVLSACSDKSTVAKVDFHHAPPPGTGTGLAVVRFGDDFISQSELTQRFSEMNPYARARYQTVEQRREYAEGLARFELLAQEAVRRGLASDPEVVEAAKRVMVQQLLKAELDDAQVKASDADVAAYYQAHQSDYVKPAMTRLFIISFEKGHREAAEATLREVLALKPLDYAGFGKLAREKSEDPRTQPLEGDTRFLADDELSAQLGPEVLAAAKGLTEVGQVHPTLVETAKAFVVVKLQGRQVALNLGVEQARPSIQSVLANDTKQARFRALLEGLKERSHYRVDDAALAQVPVDPRAPAQNGQGPQPGYIPEPAAAR